MIMLFEDENLLMSCSFELPCDFREHDILAFHNRDTLAIAEQVDGRTLRKGLGNDKPPASRSDFVTDALMPNWLLMDQRPQANWTL